MSVRNGPGSKLAEPTRPPCFRTVWVNRYRAVSYVMPFGGYKRSGVGRENGMEVMKEYLQVKSIHVNLSAAPVVNPFVKL